MNEAGVAPPGLKPIQNPIMEPRTNVRQYRGSVFQVSHTTRGLIRALAPLKERPSYMVSRISPIPNSPMTATMKSKPFMSSVTPNVRRSAPVTMSRPTEARMKPRRMETRDLMGLPPPRPMNAEKVRSWMAKNSGGRNLRATSARSGAKRVISTTEKSAPTKDDVKAAVSACPPSPRRAMGKPSKVVATDQGSPGMLKRMEVMAPPNSAPQYRLVSRMMADVGGMVKVSGSRMATPLAPPRPGSTPITVPSAMPTTATIRL